MAFKVQLPIFEGPMDLLLFFIQRDQIDIHDIPISKITENFIDYIEMLQSLDLSVGGDFLFMVSMLMRIKTRMLLPQQTDEDGDLIEDPREELMQMLIEYKKVKESADNLRGFEHAQNQYFGMGFTPQIDVDLEPDEILQDVTLLDLMMTCKRLLEDLPESKPHEIEKIEVTQKEQENFLVGLFGNRKKYRFDEVTKHLDSQLKVIVTFIAILDLIRQGMIIVNQDEQFGDFMICRTNLLQVGGSA